MFYCLGALAGCLFRTEYLPISRQGLPGEAGSRGYQVYWGDVHCHSGLSADYGHATFPFGNANGCGTEQGCESPTGPSTLFGNAERIGLDFVVITDHAEDLTEEGWRKTREAVAIHEKPGRFVPFLGYEFCDSVETRVECTNVIFSSAGGGDIYAGRSLRRPGLPALAEFLDGDGDLWTRLQVGSPEAIGIIAHPPSAQSWMFPALKRERIMGAEISSTGGGLSNWDYRQCQTSVLDGIRQGLTLQVFGSSNDHESRPGRASLTAVVSKDLSRESIFESLLNRRTYASRGTKLSFSFDADGRLMGERYEPEAGPGGMKLIKLSAMAVSHDMPLTAVSIFRMTGGKRERILHKEKVSRMADVSVEDSLPAGANAIYWAEAFVQGRNADYGAEAWTTPVYVRIK